jgi:hypothetical protein
VLYDNEAECQANANGGVKNFEAKIIIIIILQQHRSQTDNSQMFPPTLWARVEKRRFAGRE